MVENKSSFLEEKIGRSIHPYDSEAPLTAEEAVDEYNYWMEGAELLDSGKVIYHSGETYEETEGRFGVLEALALDMEEKGSEPEIHMNHRHRGRVLSSDVLQDEDVTYHGGESLEEEISEPFETSVADRSIHITSDYEADTVYRFREEFDDSEFIVMSADTSDLESEPSALDHLREGFRTPDWS